MNSVCRTKLYIAQVGEKESATPLTGSLLSGVVCPFFVCSLFLCHHRVMNGGLTMFFRPKQYAQVCKKLWCIRVSSRCESFPPHPSTSLSLSCSLGRLPFLRHINPKRGNETNTSTLVHAHAINSYSSCSLSVAPPLKLALRVPAVSLLCKTRHTTFQRGHTNECHE